MTHTHSGVAANDATTDAQVKTDLLVLTERQEKNFWSHVDKSDGTDACWPWTGCLHPKGGYGLFAVNRRIRMAHRVAYRSVCGYFPTCLKICHKCDNPPCCNPNHHFVGTQAQNVADMDAKGRRNMAKGDANGSRKRPEKRPRGENNTEAKLTNEDIVAIRSDYVPRIVTMQYLAERHGVTKGTIWKILTNQNWTHVTQSEPPVSSASVRVEPEIGSRAPSLPISQQTQFPES